MSGNADGKEGVSWVNWVPQQLCEGKLGSLYGFRQFSTLELAFEVEDIIK